MHIAVFFLLGFAILVTLYRTIKGPTVLDRLLGYSSLSAKIIVFLVVENVLSNRWVYLELAIIYAVLSFLGIAVVARFVQQGRNP